MSPVLGWLDSVLTSCLSPERPPRPHQECSQEGRTADRTHGSCQGRKAPSLPAFQDLVSPMEHWVLSLAALRGAFESLGPLDWRGHTQHMSSG